MDAIRLEKLRCLSDTGFIKIKPVTILVGENSAGKSTFLRVFPLLRQSVESPKSSPLLWNGDLVDFSNYDDAHQDKSEPGIVFSFQFRLEEPNDDDDNYDYEWDEWIDNLIEEYLDIELSLEFINDLSDHYKELTKINKFIILFDDNKINICADHENNITKFEINDLNILSTKNNKFRLQQFNNRLILPNIIEKIIDDNNQFSKFLLEEVLEEWIFQVIEELDESDGEKNRHLSSFISKLKIGGAECMLKNIKNLKKDIKNFPSWFHQNQTWTVETPEFQLLRNLSIATKVNFLIDSCNQYLSNFSKKIKYMAPLRATAERYYRSRDTVLNEVDYQGRNLGMFLRNLTETESKNFNEWTVANFGFKTWIDYQMGHISIKIESEGLKKGINLADTGFGFSQMLPIITQLWLLTNSSDNDTDNQRQKETVLFAIEQPELHLHPRLQKVLTNVLVTAIKQAQENFIDLRLMIETHSEHLINQLGALVAEKTISKDDINIVIFEKTDDLTKVNVKTAQFDDEGYLTGDWPLGFFNM